MKQTPVLNLKHSEREYFISRIRSGVYIVKCNGLKLKVYQPTIDEDFELQEIYAESYDLARNDNIKTDEEMLEWMKYSGLWSDEEEEKIEKINKDIEKLKVEIYQNRNNDRMRETIRAYIRAAEKAVIKLQEKKTSYYSTTCEGIANSDKLHAFIKKCTYLNGHIFDFQSISIVYVLNSYFSQICSDSLIRYLSRQEPWRSLWTLKDSNTFSLFINNGRNLSIDQRNLLTWSKMYDNVYESMDCPSDKTIEDDDLLDGWFIVQRQKREKSRTEQEIDSILKNEKIKNANEVFLMANSKEEAARINSMNDSQAIAIKKQREEYLQNKGHAHEQDFIDNKLKLRNMAREQFKGNFGR